MLDVLWKYTAISEWVLQKFHEAGAKFRITASAQNDKASWVEVLAQTPA